MVKKILVALSGGVDSSTVAYLLKKQGFDLGAVYIKFYAQDAQQQALIEEESQVAQTVAQTLDIPFQLLDFSQEQKSEVIDYFLASYRQGQTPNPCIVCNKLLKFGQLLAWAEIAGFSHLATGHYAQIVKKSKQFYLANAKDQSKDQSYFLYQLTEEQLAKILFPLGSLTKKAVIDLAKQANLPHLNRESFDICFLKKTNLQDFLRKNIQENPGDIIDQNGLIIGQHQGLAFYTIGQRHGFSIDRGALKKSTCIDFPKDRTPVLVVSKKIIKSNQLVVDTTAMAFAQKFFIKDLHFVNNSQEKLWQKRQKFYALVKIRNTGKLIPCQVQQQQEKILVKTKSKIFAPAAGQAAVFYQEKQDHLLLIAGATIDNVAATA